LRHLIYNFWDIDFFGNKSDPIILFCIKPPPATSKSQIQKAFGDDWPERFEFVSGDFSDCIEKSKSAYYREV